MHWATAPQNVINKAKMRKMKIRKVFLILTIIIVTVQCINSKIDEKEKTMELFKEFVNEAITRRKMYEEKMNNINIIEINGLSFMKNVDQIQQFLITINQQREIDYWNYKEIQKLFNKWQNIFKNVSQNTTDKDVIKFCKEFNEFNFETNNNIQKLIKKEADYIDSYEKFLTFIIKNNENIEIVTGELVMTNQELINEYVILVESCNKNEEDFYSFIELYKIERLNKLKTLNSSLKIEEVNNFINIFE